jgi:hypothetical protein
MTPTWWSLVVAGAALLLSLLNTYRAEFRPVRVRLHLRPPDRGWHVGDITAVDSEVSLSTRLAAVAENRGSRGGAFWRVAASVQGLPEPWTAYVSMVDAEPVIVPARSTVDVTFSVLLLVEGDDPVPVAKSSMEQHQGDAVLRIDFEAGVGYFGRAKRGRARAPVDLDWCARTLAHQLP